MRLHLTQMKISIQRDKAKHRQREQTGARGRECEYECEGMKTSQIMSQHVYYFLLLLLFAITSEFSLVNDRLRAKALTYQHESCITTIWKLTV